MSVTWGEIKKAINLELGDGAKIKEIKLSELYYRGVKICFDRAKNSYVIINEIEDTS